MQPLSVKGAAGCRVVAVPLVWRASGSTTEHSFELARALRTSLPGANHRRCTARGQPDFSESSKGSGLTHSRSRYDEGMENVIGVPVVMLLSWLFCSTNFGRLLASLVGMPFHEVGHAAGSWLSSRIAIPLPFFTFWDDDQSVWMGLLVAAVLGWLIFHTYREKNWFMLGSVSAVLLAWAVITFVVPPRQTLMWQILSGALGEIVFGGFLLVAFHFPLPDRLRWDFWRWIALVPAALCFTQALMLWRTVSADVSQMPWGSAIGSESDGDMNRLVQQFHWSANDLADLYLNHGLHWPSPLAMRKRGNLRLRPLPPHGTNQRRRRPAKGLIREAPLGFVFADLFRGWLVGAFIDGNLEVVLVVHHLRVERGILFEHLRNRGVPRRSLPTGTPAHTHHNRCTLRAGCTAGSGTPRCRHPCTRRCTPRDTHRRRICRRSRGKDV